jgi:hypothetical protein
VATSERMDATLCVAAEVDMKPCQCCGANDWRPNVRDARVFDWCGKCACVYGEKTFWEQLDEREPVKREGKGKVAHGRAS